MATLFPSFRSSGMPKRLLQYAVRYGLSRLEVLDTDALDLENLDFAWGRNSVFEFKDVAIRLEKLEKLLKLPPAFKLEKAKVLLLRLSVPIEFYTKPIVVEVDGVDVRLKVRGVERKSTRAPKTKAPGRPAVVPNPMDLAQSFLDTQPSSERKQLEDALVAETHDLGASVSVSDDGSEDESAFGTGQPLSLPAFLADYLQGILDRVQVKIGGVKFQMDVDVPVEPSSPRPEPVSFQIALDSINVEGVTAQADEDETTPAIVPKEGKRHVSLTDVRAYLVSEANVFSALARSPSVTSPSVASSPSMSRNPPSRETSSLSEGLFRDQPMASLQESFRSHLSDPDDPPEPEYPLGDSEDALAIPYEFHPAEEELEDESPATPRASVYHEPHAAVEESSFFSTVLPETASSSPTAPVEELRHDEAMWSGSTSEVLPVRSAELDVARARTPERPSSSAPASDSSGENSTEDLTKSHLFTHEEAESMYMSAFSQADPQPAMQALIPESPSAEAQQSSEGPESTEDAQAPRSVMPGGWDDSPESSPGSERHGLSRQATSSPPKDEQEAGQSDSEGSSPAFSRASVLDQEPAEFSRPRSKSQADDVATPKGPTRLVKEIFSLNSASIYIPSHHQHINVQTPPPESVAQLSQSLGRSVYPQAPGAFSLHGSQPRTNRSPPPPAAAPENVDDSLEVALSPIKIQFDASLGFLLGMVVNKLLEAVKGDAPRQITRTEESAETSEPLDIKLSLAEVSLNFLNRLGGVADTPERYLDPSGFSFDDEVLLNATMQNLTIESSPNDAVPSGKGKNKLEKEVGTLTKIDVEKVRFGYTNGDILSFDSGRPMSTSVRDTFLSTGHDIGVKIVQSAEKIRTDIETLPLVVQVELQRLDETFSWFGGLSSFLNMSTSMTSSPSPTPKTTPLPPQKPRGVRFEAPIDPTDNSVASENKVNLRIGGALVELVGRDCSVAAESSAIKLVSRDEGVGVACGMLRVSGPYLKASMADPAISTELGGIRIDFLTTPKDADLEKLLELIIPSKVKFDKGNDEIMVDTLLRQRRKGSVLRATVDTMSVRVKNMAQLAALPNLGEELAKLSTVAKYLPEDDRPGLLTLGKIQKVGVSLDFGGRLGHFATDAMGFDLGHITVPSLVAVAVQAISLKRNGSEELICSSVFVPNELPGRGPVIMGRMIGDEIEPVIKLKLQDLSIEYRVPMIMDVLNLAEDATPQDFEASLAASVASLGDQAHTALAGQPPSPVERSKRGKPMTLDIGFSDCLLGLNPLNHPSKLVVALTDSHLKVVLPKDVETKADLGINKASILLIDDASDVALGIPRSARRHTSSSGSRQVVEMCARGFVEICYMSSASVVIDVTPGVDGDKQVDVEIRDDLLVLETCADSTQTLITLVNNLKPPTPPSKENKYRTNVVPVQDLLASISAEAFGKPEGEYDFDQDFAGARELAGSESDVEFGSENSLRLDPQFYGEQSGGEEMFDAMNSSGLSYGTSMQDTNEGVLLTGPNPAASEASGDSDELAIHENYYQGTSDRPHTAKVWNSNKNTYDQAPDSIVKRSPLRISARDVHLIWNLFDGYDWEHTREVLTKAVQEVEEKAYERQSRGPQVYEEEVEDEETIGDFLFNSIYIGIPANRDPQELSRAINEGLNDNVTETESLATTSLTATTNRTARPHQQRSKRLKLNRSKHHKITFELQGVNVDMVAYPPGCGETMSSTDIRVLNLDIFDHVPSSTWKKFATYDRDQGEREMGTSMVHVELVNVKPLPELGASETVMRATVLPLRLHVDQDALDFITRFFEFKDEEAPIHTSPSDVPFVQRAEVNNIPVKLDFKPKRVDYSGLRSGHTTEFMNFIVLEEARMVLRHVIIYGVSGFERLGKMLNDIWMPDVRSNQLPGVVAGLAPVRSLVNIGSGFRDLVEIPLKEYKKDGRVVRSISKGAAAFARTTGTEMVKLGAKLAVGTQYALQGAEGMLTEQRQAEGGWEEEGVDAEEQKQISLYAEQPTGVMQGMRGGYRSLSRDVNLARDAIIAVPGEVMESQSAGSVARAVWKRAPTIIFRPAVGVTKVIGQTLMGATNTMDPNNRRRIDEKYKKH